MSNGWCQFKYVLITFALCRSYLFHQIIQYLQTAYSSVFDSLQSIIVSRRIVTACKLLPVVPIDANECRIIWLVGSRMFSGSKTSPSHSRRYAHPFTEEHVWENDHFIDMNPNRWIWMNVIIRPKSKQLYFTICPFGRIACQTDFGSQMLLPLSPLTHIPHSLPKTNLFIFRNVFAV